MLKWIFAIYDKRIKGIIEFLINSFDENGYLHMDKEEVTTILSVTHKRSNKYFE